MSLRSVIKIFIITLTIIIVAALVITCWNQEFSVRRYAETIWYSSMVVGLLGYLMFQGAGTTDDPVNDHITSQTSLDQEGFHEADQESMRIGISLGMAVCISALIVFIAALAFLYVCYP